MSKKDPIKERLTQQNQELPKWAEDFPVDTKADGHVARRDFIRFLCLVSFGLFTGQAGVLLKSLFDKKYPPSEPGAFRIIGRDDLAVGGSYVFMLPEKKEPIILIRLAEKDYVAYSQKCTHLQCPVIWRQDESKILCPCHHGAFDVKTGNVLYGPPERPLPAVKLGLRADGIYFEGMMSRVAAGGPHAV
jgi:Rieske Fe-S protein